PTPALLRLDHDLRRDATGSGSALELIPDPGLYVAIDFGMSTMGLGRDHGKAGIGLFADGHVQRHLAEERHAEAFRLVPRAAMAENIGARAAMRAEKIAHILDDAEHRHVDALEHGNAAPGVDERKVLRRRDDDRALERYLLGHGQLG